MASGHATEERISSDYKSFDEVFESTGLTSGSLSRIVTNKESNGAAPYIIGEGRAALFREPAFSQWLNSGCPKPPGTKLYRHFDMQGRLLYVGISLSAIQRLGQHQKESRWFDSITRVEIETFRTRDEAMVAEAKAIATEHPLYNQKHQGYGYHFDPDPSSVPRPRRKNRREQPSPEPPPECA